MEIRPEILPFRVSKGSSSMRHKNALGLMVKSIDLWDVSMSEKKLLLVVWVQFV